MARLRRGSRDSPLRCVRGAARGCEATGRRGYRTGRRGCRAGAGAEILRMPARRITSPQRPLIAAERHDVRHGRCSCSGGWRRGKRLGCHGLSICRSPWGTLVRSLGAMRHEDLHTGREHRRHGRMATARAKAVRCVLVGRARGLGGSPRTRRVGRISSAPHLISGMGAPQRRTEGRAISAAAARNSASPIVVVRPSS